MSAGDTGPAGEDIDQADGSGAGLALEQVQQELAALQQKYDRARELHEEYAATAETRIREMSAEKAAAAAKIIEKYFFDLKCNLRPVNNRDTVGFEVPEGIRLHVNYVPDQDPKLFEVTTDERDAASAIGQQGWEGIKAKIASGGDWVLIQKDGVAKVDARVTMKTHDQVLIDAVFSGAVDLAAAVPRVRDGAADLGAEVYAAYLNGSPQITDLPVTLTVRFEAAEQPYLRPGEDDSWIEKSRYSRNKRYFPKYRRLLRSLFVARGTITLDTKPRWPPTKIELKVYNQV